jgi:hypothetical protein
LALLLLGIGVTDLAHSVRHTRFLPGGCGAASVLVVGLLAGLTSWRDLLAVLAVAALAFGWELAVSRGFSARSPSLPLALLAAAVAAAALLSGQAGVADGALGRWLGQVPLPVLRDIDADQFLLLAGVVLLQLSTGNVLVRLALAATRTITPDAQGVPQGPERRLKGGRLLGPLERLFILGLGLAGNLTAAAIVVAAKGLLRWPELSSRLEQERIHRLTEYFLVGSFVSWLIPLSGLVLLS